LERARSDGFSFYFKGENSLETITLK
jgi:hypothetical protein